MPSFNLLQKDSSMQTPGYGEAPEVRTTIMFQTLCGLGGGFLIGPGLTQGEDLPQKNSKGPDIALCGVHPIEDGLRSHPLKREPCLEASCEPC